MLINLKVSENRWFGTRGIERRLTRGCLSKKKSIIPTAYGSTLALFAAFPMNSYAVLLFTFLVKNPCSEHTNSVPKKEVKYQCPVPPSPLKKLIVTCKMGSE